MRIRTNIHNFTWCSELQIRQQVAGLHCDDQRISCEPIVILFISLQSNEFFAQLGARKSLKINKNKHICQNIFIKNFEFTCF